jgi:exonuclease III
MRGIFWNIRGLCRRGRKQCLMDVFQKYDFDFIGIQETKTREFLISYLNSFSGRKQFC